jgi:cell division protease FtsH
MERKTQFNLWYVLFAVIAVFWLRDIYVTATQVQPIPYSEFERDLKAGQIKDIAISNNVIQGSYKAPRPDKRTRFVTTRVDPDFAKELSQYDVTYTGVIESTIFRDILSFVAPALIFFGIWIYLAKRMSGGAGGSVPASSRSARAMPRSMSRPTPR